MKREELKELIPDITKEQRLKEKEEYAKGVAQRKEEREERKRQLEEEKTQRKIERDKAREAKLAEQRHINPFS